MSAPKARPLILVVDDQPINIQILHALLKADFEVCMAKLACGLEFRQSGSAGRIDDG